MLLLEIQEIWKLHPGLLCLEGKEELGQSQFFEDSIRQLLKHPHMKNKNKRINFPP